MCETARTLIRLVLGGRGTVWLHILKNAPAPVYLSRRKFDLVVGNLSSLPREVADLFLTNSADLYLKDDGIIAFAMPRAAVTEEEDSGLSSIFLNDSTLGLHLEKIVDLDRAEPGFNVPCRMVVAKRA